jgi:hypothetical protein
MATAASVFRDFEVDGVPASGKHKPKKSEIRTLLKWYEDIMSALGLADGFQGAWDASTGSFPSGAQEGYSWIASTPGTVGGKYFGEGDQLVALVNGASTSTYAGNWVAIPAWTSGVVPAIDAGDGTANAIQITTEKPVSDDTIVVFTLFRDTTGSPVTVSINGGAALTVKTNRGNDASALTSGMEVWGRIRSSDSTFRLLNDQDVSALVGQAEAARDEAVAAAAAIPSQVVDRTEMKALDTSTVKVAFLKENGREGWFKWSAGDYSAQITADTAEGVYIKANAIASSAGAWVRQDRDTVNPFMFGALRGRANATVTTAAIQAMIEFCEREGTEYDLLGGSWFINGNGLVISAPIKGYGRGTGYWHPKAPASGDGLSTVAQTQIIATGTGNRIYTVHGISSCAVSGGVVANPSTSSGYNNGSYKLTSFMNPVSDGDAPRSPRTFSAALWIKPGAAGSDLSGFRVITDGGGDDGLDLWLTAGTTSTDWAADWDCGVVIEMAGDVRLANSEYVGHWRMYGELVLAIPADPNDDAIPAIFGTQHSNCTFAGRAAIGVRGPDLWRVTAVGADYIEFDWADDHPFDASVYNQIGYGNGSFTLTGITTFTGQSKVSGNLRLTGVASAESISVGNIITTRVFGAGTSHCKWDRDCRFNGIHHTSGRKMHDQALGANAFDSPTAVIEVSGWRLTELQFFGALQTIEEVALQAHAMSASVFVMDWEASAATDGVSGARIITSPHEAASTRVTNPAGKTQFCVIDSVRGARNETGIDWGPRYTTNAPSAFTSDTGLMEGFDIQTPSLLIDAHGINGTGSNPTASGVRTLIGMLGGILGTDGSPKFVYSEPDDKLYAYEHIFPDADNTRDLGDSTHRYRAVYALQYRFAGGSNFIKAGVGSPEGVETAPVGSLYLNLSGGTSTTLYVKTSGTGNTGWTAK